uniref:Uncharacterized protein n=1 Tax=Aegilops tauschii TaxID=37682 RepID=N1R268_AEGTA
MSLRHASRVLLRAAQAVVRARLQPPAGATARAAGGRAARGVQRAKTIRRRAEKSENVMHLVCWGPS